MKDVCKREIEDINESYDLLEEGLEGLENKILQEYIPNSSLEGQTDDIQKGLDLVKQIKKHKSELLQLRSSYNNIIGCSNSDCFDDDQELEEENEKNIKDVVDRTTWRKEKDNIRIETSRPDNSSNYTNIIPVHIFKEVVKTIVDQFVRYDKEYIKTATIYSLLKDKIIRETSYKKSPKTVVYSIIKVLAKEDILENKKNYKQMYILKKEPKYVLEWLENI